MKKKSRRVKDGEPEKKNHIVYCCHNCMRGIDMESIFACLCFWKRRNPGSLEDQVREPIKSTISKVLFRLIRRSWLGVCFCFRDYTILRVLSVTMILTAFVILFVGNYLNLAHELVPQMTWKIAIWYYLVPSAALIPLLLIFLLPVANLKTDSDNIRVVKYNRGLLFSFSLMLITLNLLALRDFIVGFGNRDAKSWKTVPPESLIDLIRFGWVSRLITDGKADTLSGFFEFTTSTMLTLAGILLFTSNWLQHRYEENTSEYIDEEEQGWKKLEQIEEEEDAEAMNERMQNYAIDVEDEVTVVVVVDLEGGEIKTKKLESSGELEKSLEIKSNKIPTGFEEGNAFKQYPKEEK